MNLYKSIATADPKLSRGMVWCTPLENVTHAIENGLTAQKGSDSVRAKFSAAEVRQIRMLSSNGMSYSKIRQRFPMAKSTLSYIVNEKTYPMNRGS